MQITHLDTADDMALRQAYDVQRRAMTLGREEAPFWSWQEMSTNVRRPDPGEREIHWIGTDEGTVVAHAAASLPLLDNTDKVWFEVAVDPGHQGRGHGRRMLEHVCAELTALGRAQLLTECKLPFDQLVTHRYRRFVEAAGFTLANVEIVRHLHLPVPEHDIDAWSAQAAEKAGGYRIETHLGEVPDELVESLCLLLGQLAVDAPTGEVDWEEERMTPERYRENSESLRAAGRTIYETVALAPDGTVAAQTTMSVPPRGRTDISQWGTFVHREHRGRRLGLAVKAANLRVVQGKHPEMRRIVTQNAETNDWMVAINELMGFEPYEASAEFIRRG